MEEDTSVHKSKYYSKRKNILEIEKKVDKILSENDKKKENIKPIESQNFDFKPFSPEKNNKNSIYYVKGKKKTEKGKNKEDKKEIISNKPIKNKTKSEIKDKPNSENTNNKSAAQVPPKTAKWLDNRLTKGSKEKSNKKLSKQKNKKIIKNKEERKKIFSSFLKPKSESISTNEKIKDNKPEKDQKKTPKKDVITKDPLIKEKNIVNIKTKDTTNDKNRSERLTQTRKADKFNIGDYSIITSKRTNDQKKKTEPIEKTDVKDSIKKPISINISDKDIKKDDVPISDKNITEKNFNNEKSKDELADHIINESEKKHLEKKVEFATEDKTDKDFDSKKNMSSSSIKLEKEDTSKKSEDKPKKEVIIEGITPDGKINYLNEANKLKSVTIKSLGYSEGSWEELDFYPLEEPFAYVEIIREKDTLDKRYVLVEISLNEEEKQIFKFITDTLSGFSVNTNDLETKGEESYLIDLMDQIIEDYALKIDPQSKKKMIYFLKKQFLGLGKLEVLMKDPQIEDVSCDGSGVSIFLYHRRYGSLKSNVLFEDEEELSDFVVKLAQKCGKHISIAEPMLDATMPDGSRLQMTLSTEVTTKGSTFTIRKFKEDPFSPPDLIEFNTMSSEMVAYLWLAVENGINALVAGGTAAGKTSTLNAFCLFIPRESKIVSIEETREVNLPHPNWIPGVSRSGFGEVVGGKVVGEIDTYDLMKAALRQRPEYILVGEIRGREAYVLFQAMATGHTTYSTVHADSAASLIHRLEGKPINIPRIMLQALDIVCIQVISRIKNKRARRCKQIIEIIDIDPTTKEILTNEVFRWDPVEDKFIYNGKSYILERIRGDKDLSREEMTQEVNRRSQLLEWMNKNNVREFKKVATLIAQYFDNPAQLMEKVQDGKLL